MQHTCSDSPSAVKAAIETFLPKIPRSVFPWLRALIVRGNWTFFLTQRLQDLNVRPYTWYCPSCQALKMPLSFRFCWKETSVCLDDGHHAGQRELFNEPMPHAQLFWSPGSFLVVSVSSCLLSWITKGRWWRSLLWQEIYFWPTASLN